MSLINNIKKIIITGSLGYIAYLAITAKSNLEKNRKEINKDNFLEEVSSIFSHNKELVKQKLDQVACNMSNYPYEIKFMLYKGKASKAFLDARIYLVSYSSTALSYINYAITKFKTYSQTLVTKEKEKNNLSDSDASEALNSDEQNDDKQNLGDDFNPCSDDKVEEENTNVQIGKKEENLEPSIPKLDIAAEVERSNLYFFSITTSYAEKLIRYGKINEQVYRSWQDKMKAREAWLDSEAVKRINNYQNEPSYQAHPPRSLL